MVIRRYSLFSSTYYATLIVVRLRLAGSEEAAVHLVNTSVRLQLTRGNILRPFKDTPHPPTDTHIRLRIAVLYAKYLLLTN